MTHDKRSAVEQIVELLRIEAPEALEIDMHAFSLVRILRAAPKQVREAIGGLIYNAAEHVGPICRLLTDPSPRTRGRAAWALGNIGSPEAVSNLIASALTDADPRVREAAATSLGQIRQADDQVCDALRWAVRHDDSAYVRRSAQAALNVLLQMLATKFPR